MIVVNHFYHRTCFATLLSNQGVLHFNERICRLKNRETETESEQNKAYLQDRSNAPRDLVQVFWNIVCGIAPDGVHFAWPARPRLAFVDVDAVPSVQEAGAFKYGV